MSGGKNLANFNQETLEEARKLRAEAQQLREKLRKQKIELRKEVERAQQIRLQIAAPLKKKI